MHVSICGLLYMSNRQFSVDSLSTDMSLFAPRETMFSGDFQQTAIKLPWEAAGLYLLPVVWLLCHLSLNANQTKESELKINHLRHVQYENVFV